MTDNRQYGVPGYHEARYRRNTETDLWMSAARKNRMLCCKVQVRIDGMSAARPGVSGILRRMDEGGDWAGQLAEMFNR